VKLDPDRARHIQWGFQAYATGDLSLSQLSDILYERGLRNRSKRKGQKSDKVKVPALHKILRDPYYIGIVMFRGVRYDGNHPKLIAPEVFERVQQLLTARRTAGDRSHKHGHYLRGVVHCGRCGRALMFTKCKGQQGERYDYFVCIGRHRDKNCDLPYLPVHRVEQFVTNYYESKISVSAERVEELKPRLLTQFDRSIGHRQKEVIRSEKELAGLRAQRQQLVDSHLANPKAVPLDVLEVKQGELEGKISQAERKLERASGNIEKSVEGLEAAHQLLIDAPGTYAEAAPHKRRALNQVFFTKLLISPAGIEGVELTDEYAGLLAEDLMEEIEKAEPEQVEPPFRGGSTLERIVEAPRFELGSAEAVRGCLQV
jgi:site-specific DNA recombinase